ncbi:MAG: hypothetical protein ABH844_03695 [Candidatus Omnitrophota bacterium]
MNKYGLTLIVFSISSGLILSNGCVSSNCFQMKSLTASNIKDLKDAKAFGEEKTIALPPKEAYDAVMKIAKSNGLTVYQKSKKKGYLVVIGFVKQVNTTRVGIFFERAPENKTRVTLSSLSKATLQKAKTIIFDKL